MTDEVPRIRLVVVDDHPVVREGIRSMVLNFGQIQLVNVCSTGEEALAEVSKHPVDVMLADMRMAPMSGVTLLKLLKEKSPQTRVLILSSYESEEEIYQALRAGASGYLNKHASAQVVLNSILAIHAGKLAFSQRILDIYKERATRRDITQREYEVLGMMAKGLTNKEIGAALSVSQFTVRNQVKSICEKLEVADRTEATRAAIERGILILDESG